MFSMTNMIGHGIITSMKIKFPNLERKISLSISNYFKVEARLNFLKKETQNYTSRCAAKAKKLVEDVEIETHNVDIVEREVADVLEICAWELYALVDSVSKYKEHMASKISEMKSNLSETAGAVSDSYKGFLSAQFGITLDTSH
ncbi:hypothetical protein PVL29_003522 [Vitis rotundifolia]|uniref:Uncharacterized protein n=1 Tax=Vitis rotundifolia TaxID=103349 RepID=A0AA39E589_VITRO|nr:hypothetical protein PVL29_003522 [Vitis rotundifolia]